MVPAKPGAPFDIKGKTVCYIIPSLANPFLNGVATSVTEKFKADGVVVNVYGADEGGLNQQFDQIENCISMKSDFMYVMAAGEFDPLVPAVEEAKKAGIMVMGVPPLRNWSHLMPLCTPANKKMVKKLPRWHAILSKPFTRMLLMAVLKLPSLVARVPVLG